MVKRYRFAAGLFRLGRRVGHEAEVLERIEDEERCTSAVCRRAACVFGLLYEHDHLNAATHDTTGWSSQRSVRTRSYTSPGKTIEMSVACASRACAARSAIVLRSSFPVPIPSSLPPTWKYESR